MPKKKKSVRTTKREKPLSLSTVAPDFEGALRVILKSPPMPKKKKQGKDKKSPR